MKSFAIILICYNRLSGIERLVKSLERVNYCGRQDIDLIFSIDNSGNNDVENFANDYCWAHGKKIVRTFPERQGLKQHVLQCGDYTTKYDIITVLEDDILVSDSFYIYAYSAAEFYWDDDNIAGISLYGFQKNWLSWTYRFDPMRTGEDSYFMKIAQSWGQVWTKPKWKDFRCWYDTNMIFNKSDDIPQYLNEWPESSWLKYHDRYCIEKNKYFVYPYVSLSTNCSDAGTHANRTTNDHQVELQFNKEHFSFPVFSKDAVCYDEYMNRLFLGKYMGFDDNELTVDFYGTKRTNRYKRYLLTVKKLNYRIDKTYALALRPIEANVILDIEGEGIFLYDTSQVKKNTVVMDSDYELKLYSLRSHEWKVFLPLSLKMSVKEIISSIKRKVNKWMK